MCRDPICLLNVYHAVSVNFFPLLMLTSKNIFAKIMSVKTSISKTIGTQKCLIGLVS